MNNDMGGGADFKSVKEQTDDEMAEEKVIREQFYSELAKKSRKTQLDRIKEQILDLPKSERDKLDEWNIDRRLDEQEKAESEAMMVSAVDFVEEAAERVQNWDKMVGLSTGYWTMDNMTMGLAPGELIVVAGQTSHGKTLMATNIAARLLMQDHNVMFVTLEMTHAEITSRFIKILEHLGDIDKLEHLTYQENEKLSWKAIPILVKKAVEQGVELIVIDHLHYFSREMDNTAEGLGMVTQEFKRAALKHNVPIILISHTRKVEKGRAADISDLRGSSYIAQDADIVLMVSQKQDFPGKIFVELEKNRNRLCYNIGTDIGYCKNGLFIEDFVYNNENIVALDRNRFDYDESAKPITAKMPSENATAPAIPPVKEVRKIDNDADDKNVIDVNSDGQQTFKLRF